MHSEWHDHQKLQLCRFLFVDLLKRLSNEAQQQGARSRGPLGTGRAPGAPTTPRRARGGGRSVWRGYAHAPSPPGMGRTPCPRCGGATQRGATSASPTTTPSSTTSSSTGDTSCCIAIFRRCVLSECAQAFTKFSKVRNWIFMHKWKRLLDLYWWACYNTLQIHCPMQKAIKKTQRSFLIDAAWQAGNLMAPPII